MLFNSIDFAVFLPIVFVLYWFVANKSLKTQNLLIVISSFIFYGWWDWRFLFLMIASASVDFFVGIFIHKKENITTKKFLLSCSILVNLGILAFFKYFNFFVENFVAVFSLFGTKFNPTTMKIVLPVGISFYTFQALSYTIDIYREKLKPTRSIIDYFAFISFFPQLVAGPIERATNLLPQILKARKFDYYLAVDGMQQMLWGLFKKMVIADNIAIQVNSIFQNYDSLYGSTLWLGIFYFAIQIYCDFSGYSDIAIGTARLFGFNIMQNFAFPYFSRDIAEFWRRWHISLSTWFRDYLYFPIGGSRGGLLNRIRNTLIIFVVSGFWHGANWTFIIWGVLNALYFLPLIISKSNRKYLDTVAAGRVFPNFKELIQIMGTFLLTLFAWVFFRSPNLTVASNYIQGMFSTSIILPPQNTNIRILFPLILVLLFFEWNNRNEQYGLKFLMKINKLYRTLIYYAFIISILYFYNNQQSFIYFQF